MYKIKESSNKIAIIGMTTKLQAISRASSSQHPARSRKEGRRRWQGSRTQQTGGPQQTPINKKKKKRWQAEQSLESKRKAKIWKIGEAWPNEEDAIVEGKSKDGEEDEKTEDAEDW